MNCKQGDLAIVVRSVCGNEGRIVRCVRLHDDRRRDADGRPAGVTWTWPRWQIDPPLKNAEWGLIYTAADAHLRPLRGGTGVDEMLRIAGLPRATEGVK